MNTNQSKFVGGEDEGEALLKWMMKQQNQDEKEEKQSGVRPGSIPRSSFLDHGTKGLGNPSEHNNPLFQQASDEFDKDLDAYMTAWEADLKRKIDEPEHPAAPAHAVAMRPRISPPPQVPPSSMGAPTK